MKIYITGTGGFVGGHLYRYLKLAGHEVISLTSNRRQNTESNSKTIEEFKNIIKNEGGFTFIHAGWAGVQGYDRNEQIQLENISQTFSLYKKCLELNCKHFILFGSQAEYRGTNSIITEESPICPETLYGFAKDTARRLIELQQRVERNPCLFSHLRLFDVYGPGDNETWVLPMVVSRLRKGENVELTSCNQIWNYLHIEDVCSAVLGVLTKGASGIFNLCGDENLPLKDFILKAASKMRRNDLIYLGRVKHHSETRNIIGCNKKLKDMTGWKPKYMFDRGIETMLGN